MEGLPAKIVASVLELAKLYKFASKHLCFSDNFFIPVALVPYIQYVISEIVSDPSYLKPQSILFIVPYCILLQVSVQTPVDEFIHPCRVLSCQLLKDKAALAPLFLQPTNLMKVNAKQSVPFHAFSSFISLIKYYKRHSPFKIVWVLFLKRRVISFKVYCIRAL